MTSPRFKEVAVQCDILHETSIGKGTQLEPLREDFQVQCDLIVTAPFSTSTPECSSVKSLGGRSVDDDKDFDYVPPTDLSLKEAEDDIEEYEGSPSK